jgi:hypothetical protein
MKGRQFLLTSVHLEDPVLFETRWVMSYLKGPVSLQDIATLMDGRQQKPAVSEPAATTVEPSGRLQEQPPLLGETLLQRYYLPSVYSEEIVFEPWLAARATVRFYNASSNIDQVSRHQVRIYLDEGFRQPRFSESEPFEVDLDLCPDSAPGQSSFYPVPAVISSQKSFAAYEKEFSEFLYQSRRLELLRVPSLKMESKPGESEADFMVRVADRLREDKEAAAEKLLQKFNANRDQLQKKLDSALTRLDKEQGDVSMKTTDTIISFGTAVLGAFLGRKAVSSSTMTRTASGIRKAGRLGKEKDDVRRAEELVARLEQELEALDTEQNMALQELAHSYDASRVEQERFAIKPRRSDIYDVQICLLWEMVPPRLENLKAVQA